MRLLSIRSNLTVMPIMRRLGAMRCSGQESTRGVWGRLAVLAMPKRANPARPQARREALDDLDSSAAGVALQREIGARSYTYIMR